MRCDVVTDEGVLQHADLHPGSSEPHDWPLRDSLRPTIQRNSAGGAVGAFCHREGVENMFVSQYVTDGRIPTVPVRCTRMRATWFAVCLVLLM